MKKLILIFLLSFVGMVSYSQSLYDVIDTNKIKGAQNNINQSIQQINNIKDTVNKKVNTIVENKNDIFNKVNEQESVWDNGIPIIPEDEGVMNLIYQLNEKAITDVNKLTKDQVRIYRELGLEFYNRGMYQEADFYLSKIKNYTESKRVQLKDVFTDNTKEIKEQIRQELDKEYQGKLKTIEESKTELTLIESESLKKDADFIKSIPAKLEQVSKEDLEKLSKQIEGQIQKLTKERDFLMKNNGSQELIDSKNGSIKSLKKEKQVIDLNIDKEQLKEEKAIIRRWLWFTALTISVLILSIFVIIQRKTIKVQDKEIEKQLEDINKKNTYLEHAARIIRHDMHSGINTYIPRGISSLEKRLTPEQLIDLRIDGSVKMIREGLNHTQRVYKSVYEFTNLVKQNVVLDKKEVNLKELLDKCILTTSYTNQVEVKDLPISKVNETLFWNAVDNIIKNGLKYNKSENKFVKIYTEDEFLIIEDNGIGLSQSKFEKILKLSKTEEDSGLGLNISYAILKEHGFDLTCEEIKTGTKMKIKL